MNNQSLYCYKWLGYFFLFFLTLFFGCVNPGISGSSSHIIKFKARFIPGSCNISVQPQSINWGTVQSSDVKQAGEKGFAPKDFVINYADCSGYGVEPKLQINGKIFTAGIPLFSDNNNLSETDAAGYGIRLVHSNDISKPLNNNDTAIVAAKNIPLGQLNGTHTDFQASISCGDSCHNATLRNGIINASVIFTFLYE